MVHYISILVTSTILCVSASPEEAVITCEYETTTLYEDLVFFAPATDLVLIVRSQSLIWNSISAIPVSQFRTGWQQKAHNAMPWSGYI